MAQEKILVYVTKEVKDAVMEIADKEKRSATFVVSRILEKALTPTTKPATK